MYSGFIDPAPMFYSDKAWYTLSRYGNSKKKKYIYIYCILFNSAFHFELIYCQCVLSLV